MPRLSPLDSAAAGLVIVGLAACVTFLTLALTCWSAPLTEAEKALLHASVSSVSANEYGRAASAEGLAKIIKLEEPTLVRQFGLGMQQAGISVLPAQIESLVVAHFDHPRIGVELRSFHPKYQTRRLFDLHYARMRAAYKTDDPSFYAILNTDLAGIEGPVMQLVHKFPSGLNNPNRALFFLGQRKYPEAVPLLLAALPESYQPGRSDKPEGFNQILRLLMGYPSVDVWRRTRDEIETLYRTGKITAAIHASAAKDLGNLLNDPEKASAEIARQEQIVAYAKQRDALRAGLQQIGKLRDSDPQRYADEYRKYLEKLETLPAEYPGREQGLAGEYFRLATFVRFRLRNPAEGVELYAKADRHGHLLGRIAVADTYQFDLRDNNKAAESYRRALEELQGPAKPGSVSFYTYGDDRSKLSEWLKSWLPQEIRYLKTGKPSNDSIGEAAIGGFFTTVYGWGEAVRQEIAPDLPAVSFGYRPGLPGYSRPADMATAWSEIEAVVARVDRGELVRKLNELPASRLTLTATIQPLTALPDADSILRYLEKHDPSGYWSACLLGTAFFISQKGEAGKNEALRNGAAHLMPGMAAATSLETNPLGVAAARFLRARGLRVMPKVAPGQ